MKNGVFTQIDWSLIGAQLAQESDVEQSDFFKAFVKEALTYGTSYQCEMQMTSIGIKLTDKEKDVLYDISYRENK